jgi:hypothetical protein
MANAKKDQNGVSTMIAALNTNGTSIVNVKINPSNHGVKVNDASTGTGFGRVVVLHDNNHVPTMAGVASTTVTVNGINYIQGVTPVLIYADSSGSLLVDSS